VCRSLPINVRASPLSISPRSASASAMLSTARRLAHMFGDYTEEEPGEPAAIVQGRLVDRLLQ